MTVVAPKARNMKPGMIVVVAPKARNIKARGKRERSEARRPWMSFQKKQTSPERAEIRRLFITAFQAFRALFYMDQGRRASRLPLAIIFRAFGAKAIDPDFGADAIDPDFGTDAIGPGFGANAIEANVK